MDKYQKLLMKYVKIYQSLDDGVTYQADCLKNVLDKDKSSNSDHFEKEQIYFYQIKDIFKKKFFVIALGNAIDKFYICKNQRFIELEDKREERLKLGNTKQFPFEIDFDDRIESIKIVFKDDFAEDLILPVNYIEADKEEYYREIATKERNELLAAASVRHSTGSDLVNIYFQPCSKDYDHTEIHLFVDNQLIAKYNVESEMFFKSIAGLAFGEYEYIVMQYNCNNEVLLQTDKIKFKLSPIYGGKPIVRPQF